MLAYAASRPAVVDRRPHPNTMMLIIAAHVGLIAAVMSAKIEIHRHRPDPPIVMVPIANPAPPPPHSIAPRPRPDSMALQSDRPQPQVRTSAIDLPPVDLGPASIDVGPIAWNGTGAASGTTTTRIVSPVKSEPRLITPQSELRPPYPASKLLNGEEASLTLQLTIDQSGRVIAVDPIGRADPVFVEAARRHMIAHWRYTPASEDGRPVPSTILVTLRFELNG